MQFAPLNEAQMRNSTEMSKEMDQKLLSDLSMCFLCKLLAFKSGHKFTFSLLQVANLSTGHIKTFSVDCILALQKDNISHKDEEIYSIQQYNITQFYGDEKVSQITI